MLIITVAYIAVWQLRLPTATLITILLLKLGAPPTVLGWL